MFEKEFDQIFTLAKKKNISEFDVYLTKEKSFTAFSFQEDVDKFDYKDSIGIGVRVIVNNLTGYGYTEKLSLDAFDTMLEKAKENAKLVESDERVELENYPDIEKKLNIYNPDLEKISVQTKIERAKELERSARGYSKKIVNVPYAYVADSSSITKVANSKGLDKEYKFNISYGFVMALAKGDKHVKSGGYYIIDRDFAKIDAQKIGSEAARRAISLLDAKEIKSGEYPVIFTNEMTATILTTFSSIFSAKAVQEGQSLLRGKLGTEVANPIVSILDDAFIDIGFATRPFDDEGYPSQTTSPVSDGVLKSYLHNTITARKDNTKSTGNASRSYKGTVGVMPSNLFIQNGTTTVKELYSKVPRCIEIVDLSGMHSGCNPISGDFSLGAQGFYYENGECKFPIHNFTISGNFIQLLKNIVGIGNDLQFFQPSTGSPTILVESLSIGG
jgi:PmbA protein